ncbi:hypothetical protein [Kribbella sancticallisti]|uniref:hypothetical protein n=1 Tax=Kribbella sancticallisti TaxID=460087 RepID=UPI0031DD323A
MRIDQRCSPAAEQGVARWRGRAIGPWGTAARALAGAGGIALALVVPHERPLLDLAGASSDVMGLLFGLVVVPAALTLAVRSRGRNAPRLHLGHGAACLATLLTIVAAQFYPIAVILAVAGPLVLQAILGRAGCELLAVPNLLLRRDDYLFCLPFSPIDTWEAGKPQLR